MLRNRLSLAVYAGAVLAAVSLRADGVTRRDADSMRQKVAFITGLGERPDTQIHRTTVTENEVNAYLMYDAPADLPAGVVEPAVTMIGTGRITARAIVDLDTVRKQRNSSSAFDPMSYLSGRLPVTATGTFTTSNGVGRFDLESATVSSVPVPKAMLQQILSHYSRTSANPGGIALDDPFPLPARIREIQLQQGQAVVVQ